MELVADGAIENLPSTSQQLSKLGICEVCKIQDAKYTCPRCDVKTCCLRCSSIHKREVECNGARDRTKFIRLGKFSNMDMSSDYHLLEEIGRSIANYKKGLKKKHPQDHILPTSLFRLQKCAQKQKIYLKYLPAHFQRRKANSTRLKYDENVIYWMIQLVFVNANCLRVIEAHVAENTEIKSVVGNVFSNLDYTEKLQVYLKTGLHGARYFLKAEEVPGNKFYEMDVNKSVADNLRGKVIIEYPIVHVVLNEFADSDNVIEQEWIDEGKSVQMVFNYNAQTMKINNNDPDDIYTSMKNLLFINDDI